AARGRRRAWRGWAVGWLRRKFTASVGGREAHARHLMRTASCKRLQRSHELGFFSRRLASTSTEERSLPPVGAAPCGIDGSRRRGAGATSIEHFLVDDVFANRLTVERAQDVLGSLQTHAVERFLGHP